MHKIMKFSNTITKYLKYGGAYGRHLSANWATSFKLIKKDTVDITL